jgi:hypothetical protein
VGHSFGWLLALAALGALCSVRNRRTIVAALLPYPLVALPFYSCWSHPDARYLAGTLLCLMPLAALGALLACRCAADGSLVARLLAALAAALVAVGGVVPWWHLPGVDAATRALAIAIGVCALSPLVLRDGVARRRLVVLAPALVLVGLAALRLSASSGARDPFQAPEVERARRSLGALVPPGAVLLTSELLGRPAENAAHYLGVDAFYLDELSLLHSDRVRAALVFAASGRRTFFLLDDQEAATLAPLRTMGSLRLVERRPRDAALEWFVDPERAPQGVVLLEFTLPEERRELLQDFRRHVGGQR